ncbi:MAG: SagB/ThcOx family dehydrogenase [Deltaproteobacteria bacterium]|nr:SagB/ThcOx family dehydrogenase [Deltaproteobacteria bacterium]MBW2134631.1 SagB/ThcOx family dehydrogenase [Deltaproteobacteria bacterium]
MTDLGAGIGIRYLFETRYDRESLGESREHFARAPAFKEYPPDTQRVSLPIVADQFKADFWTVVRQRRSLRDYLDSPVSQAALAGLLWASQGVTLTFRNFAFRAVPSAGALYPVETYVAVHRVTGLNPGIWHFQVREFGLELVSPGDCRRELVAAGLNQSFLGTAAVVFIWSGILRRSLWKYRQRAIRYLFLDAGHICQSLHLAATALGLGCCPVGAFLDGEVERLLQIDGQEEVALYMAAIGRVNQ